METIKFIVKVFCAAIVALVVTMAVDALDVFHYRYAFVSVYAGTAIGVAALLGVFDMSAQKRNMKHTSVKDAARYSQAAIFVGTACLFIGTPQECEDVCDDLWHHGQKAEVRALTGEETFDIL